MAVQNLKIVVAVKKIWFPCYSQLVIAPRKPGNYLYSLWVGLSSPILNLPRMLWAFILRPALHGFGFVVSFIFTSVIAGIGGRAAGIQVTPLLSDDKRIQELSNK